MASSGRRSLLGDGPDKAEGAVEVFDSSQPTRRRRASGVWSTEQRSLKDNVKDFKA
jgi:hypothetical protein